MCKAGKLLCLRTFCEAVAISRKLARRRGGVGKYLHFLRIREVKNLVTCDHVNLNAKHTYQSDYYDTQV